VTRILVVEDQRDLALGLRANLEVEGYEVDVAETGEDALRLAADRRPDVVILDIMLPGMDGYEVLARLRAAKLAMPVLMLTARAEEFDKVRGFRAGADDYVTKPFGVMELLVRIQALLRRGPPRESDAQAAASPPGALRLGDVEVDLESHTVRRNGEELSLTPKAVELLLALYRRQGKVASRHELLRDVWGYTSSVTTRTVDAHVAELRRKLEADPAEPKHILTVWKVGYRLRA
jgi:two-component system, OmpR family, alkaline phosphatase synthesis response regulator PhoP